MASKITDKISSELDVLTIEELVQKYKENEQEAKGIIEEKLKLEQELNNN